METRRYASCSYCGSAVDEQHVRLEMWFGDKLVVFQHVPAGVCDHCGEEYFSADIQDKMIALFKTQAEKTMQVPVYSFSDSVVVKKSAARQKKVDKQRKDDKETEVHLATDDEISKLLNTEFEKWDE